jgi:signal peptide peptidase sppA, 36K type
MNESLLIELCSADWAISETAIAVLERTVARTLSDPTYKIEPIDMPIRANTNALVNMDVDSGNPFDCLEQDSVAIIPLVGVMTKYSSWYRYGCDELANIIRLANASEKISGVVLYANTPGGDIQAVFQLQDAITHMTKPIVTLTDGYLCSCGIWVASYTEHIFALNEMNVIGSVGVMYTIYDYSAQDEKYGIKSTTVYPPESKWKNLPERDITKTEPDDTLLIRERLSPLAVQFQNVIKENIPDLDLSVEGIIEGRDFYAKDALQYHFIDGIMNLDDVVEFVKSEAKKRESILSTF